MSTALNYWKIHLTGPFLISWSVSGNYHFSQLLIGIMSSNSEDTDRARRSTVTDTIGFASQKFKFFYGLHANYSQSDSTCISQVIIINFRGLHRFHFKRFLENQEKIHFNPHLLRSL